MDDHDHLPSSASEQDSLSDSDWLDVVSSRESDDNDSLASDHDEIPSASLSRRSSMSLGSSREGDVDAWEGFVVDSGDELSPHMYPVPPTLSGPPQLERLCSSPAIEDNQDTVEDERIREGLEQSLISTLSASRSSSAAHSASTHTSLHDLRLSFPDPLTSSKDNLDLPRPGTPPLVELATEVTSVEPLDTITSELEQPELPGTLVTTPEIVQSSKHDADIDIILYGSSPASKWSLIEELLRKAASYTHRTLLRTAPSADTDCFCFEIQAEGARLNKIAVHDCTQGPPIYSTSSNSDRPSLAVVFLPSPTLHALPEHTFYLPITIDSNDTDDAGDTSARDGAESVWTSLSVPVSKTLRLGSHSPSRILSSSEIQKLDSYRAHRVLQRLVLHTKKQTVKTLSDHLSSVPAVTFFALMSIVMSFAINTVFKPPGPTPTSANKAQTVSDAWSVTNTQLNSSTTLQCGNALMASSLKDFALAVIHPSGTSLSIASQLSVTSQPSYSKAMAHSGSQSPAQLANTASTEIILRAVPATSRPSVSVACPIAERKERDVPPSSALSIRMANSVSEVFETTFKAAIDAVRNDLQELYDAMDDLMRAIQAQTKKAMEKSVDAAQVIRSEVMYRNERARDKAREIKEKSEQFIQVASEQFMETTWGVKKKGEKFMAFAHEHIKGRTVLAKEKARKRVMRKDVWRAYVENQEEWLRMLLDGDMARWEYKKWMKRARRERRQCAARTV
ncbi:hypothetical protein AX15_001963 [Amanita polypyramis BW_CC]|nr:hypothetical protein AX15_001963 [Amanita polypyramis BW_CC]